MIMKERRDDARVHVASIRTRIAAIPIRPSMAYRAFVFPFNSEKVGDSSVSDLLPTSISVTALLTRVSKRGIVIPVNLRRWKSSRKRPACSRIQIRRISRTSKADAKGLSLLSSRTFLRETIYPISINARSHVPHVRLVPAMTYIIDTCHF